jgi:hypothetical protein
MADKPRVKAPKQRTTAKPDDGRSRRTLLLVVAATATILVAVAGVFFLAGGAGGGTNADDAEAALTAAGCTFEPKPAVANVSSHADFPNADGKSDRWNTDPPTSGPHFGTTIIYGAYTDPPQLGRIVHNLEHGAVYILYGEDVPEETVAQLQTFYEAHQNGTILGPYPQLGDKIALGSWLVDGLPDASSDRGTGVLAKCTQFDQAAFDAFFAAFQFKGPESFLIRPSNMRPGDN